MASASPINPVKPTPNTTPTKPPHQTKGKPVQPVFTDYASI